MTFGHLKLGKNQPKVDPRTLKFAKYLIPHTRTLLAPLPVPPLNGGYTSAIADWPICTNDVLGSCAIAAADHMIEQWTGYANPPGFTPSDAQTITAYSAVSGYVPGDPSTDNGAAMLDVLNYWRQTGIGGHKILGYVSVDPSNQNEVQEAILLFGNVYLGVALPVSAQRPPTGLNGYPVWEIPSSGPNGDGTPGSWGGHAIPIVAWGVDAQGNRGTEVITWGSVVDMTWDFLSVYGDECYAVLSLDWIEKTGLSPSKFNLAQLQHDLIQVTQMASG